MADSFSSIDDIMAANIAAGEFFFSPKSLEFRKEVILQQVYHGKYFIVKSFGNPDGPLFQAFEVYQSGRVHAIGTKFNTAQLAKSFIDDHYRDNYAGTCPVCHMRGWHKMDCQRRT